MRDRHEVTGRARPYRGETLYSWDGSAERVGYIYWNSLGRGQPRYDGRGRAAELDFGDETYTAPDGRKMTISTLWRKVDERLPTRR